MICKHCKQPIERDWANDVTVMRGSVAETKEAWIDEWEYLFCRSTDRRHAPLIETIEDILRGLKAIEVDLR